MSRAALISRLNPGSLLPVAVGTWAAAVALSPSMTVKFALTAPLLLGALLWWVILHPSRWIAVLFVSLFLLPPLPIPLGDAGVHLAPLAAALGLLIGIVWIRDWQSIAHPLSATFAIFLAVLVASAGLATVYSGWRIGLGSLARVLLFAIGVFVFFYCYAGPRREDWNDFRVVRLLFWLAVTGAIFACADFYFQFPAPAGYGDQFVWLDEGVLRRAQGLFYEASTLGNVCAFFLVMVAVSFFRKRGQSPCSRRVLLFGGLALSAALMFSYSRASVFNVAAALCALACIRLRAFRRSFLWRSLLWTIAAVAVTGFAVHFVFPSFSVNYWGRLLGSFSFFWEAPDKVLSGRIGHWQTILDFLSREPWHAIFGVGYKTLPYSNFVGSTVIADNTYLGLLVETGVVGLAAFLALNIAILRTAWGALRSTRPSASFFGEWMFCFWCGQMVQMFSGDLITYWRVLPVYFWVLGATARQALDGQ